MDVEFFAKIAGVFLSIFTLYKVFIDVVLARSSKRRDEYNFTKKYLEDLSDSSTHPYILEKGFLALTGNNLPVNEIKHLIDLENPTQAIARRASVDFFVKFNKELNNYEWRKKYRTSFYQNYGSTIFLTGYVLSCSTVLFPVFIKGIEIINSLSILCIFTSLIIIALYDYMLTKIGKFQNSSKVYESNSARKPNKKFRFILGLRSSTGHHTA